MIVKDSGGKDFDPVPTGLHQAVCYGLVDIGTHIEEWQGQKNERRIVHILFELPHQTIEINDKTMPMGMNWKFTLTLHKKGNLRGALESWRSKPFTEMELIDGFELKDIIGKNCQLNVIHNVSGDKTYANISSVVPLSQGMNKMEQFNVSCYYSMDEKMDIPKNTPKWLVEKIYKSMEWMDGPGQYPEDHGTEEPPPPDDDILF
jgi:hypothetical protein